MIVYFPNILQNNDFLNIFIYSIKLDKPGLAMKHHETTAINDHIR